MVGKLSVLDVFYIGLERFTDRTQDNHAWVLDKVRSRFGNISLHRFLQPHFDRSDCPVAGDIGGAGGLQTWDFMKAAQRLTSPLIMKMRTDLWFAKSSLDPLLRGIDRCVSGQIDVAYLGSNVKQGFELSDDTHSAQHAKKVPDFVIIARRSAVLDIDRVRAHLLGAPHDVASGNRVFKIITANLQRSELSWCRIFLVRNQHTPLQDWHVAMEFVRGYPHGTYAEHYLLNCCPQKPL